MSKYSYRSIAKANTILGSVQFITIIIGIVRSKLVALLLGPAGVGLMGLYQSTIDLVKSMSNMGIQTSAVRDVALANDANNKEELGQTKTVVSRIVWITGLLGFCIMFLGAPWLSEMTFGNRANVWAIRVLAVVPLITQLTVQHQVLLQGMRALKQLAMAGIWGGLIGLFINIPLFYIWGEGAIVPVLIIIAVASYLIAWYNARKLKVPHSMITWKESFQKGRGMVKMGFLIGITAMMDMIVVYVVKIAVQNWGSLTDVGLYTAGFAIVQSYVNLIFSAIGTDYYPRLASVSNNREEYCDTINKQFEILILVLTPMVLVFMSFSSELLYLLYSSKFIPANMMISWLAFGMLFRAYTWCRGYMYLAKSDTKIYFITYVIAFLTQLFLTLGGYKLWGLTGIGISFGLCYVVSNSYGYFIAKLRYGFQYGREQNKYMLFAIMSAASILIISYVIESPIRYLAYVLVIVFSSFYCYKELNKRLDISSIVKSKFKH